MNWENKDSAATPKGEGVKVYTRDKEVRGDIGFSARGMWIAAVSVFKRGAAYSNHDSYYWNFSTKEEAKAWTEKRVMDQCDARREGKRVTEGQGCQRYEED